MAITYSTPGQYTLGGISAPRTGVAESFQAGVSANLGRQETRQVMQAREQAMRIAASEEQRRQQAFEAQQRAAAAAAARAAQQRAAFEAYTRAATATPTVPEAGVRRPVDDFRAGGGTFPLAPPSRRSVIIPELGFPSPLGEPAPPRAGVQFPSVFNQGAGTDALAGGGGTDTLAGAVPQAPIRTGQTTTAGRPVFQDPATGELYSERTETYQAPNGAFYNVPMVNAAGGQISPAELDAILSSPRPVDPVTGEPLVPYSSVDQAVTAARARSDSLLPAAASTGQPARAEFGGIAFDVYPDGRIVNTRTNTELPMTGEFDALRSALTQQAGMSPAGVDSRAAAAQTFGESVRSGVGGALDRSAGVLSAAGTGLYGLASDVLGPVAATVGATDIAAALERQADIAYNVALTNLRQGLSATAGLSATDFDMEPETFRAAVRQAEAAFEAEEPAEPPTPPERTGQDPFIVEQDTPTGPIAGLSPAGATNPVAATEAAAAAAPDEDPSAYFISNPNLVLDLQEQLARERQVLEARLQYAQATGNTALFDQTFDALNSKERVVNENMITGQIAILAAQQDNFGPLQEFMQRAYPNDDVQVIPYTNGTVSFFINGEESGTPMRTTELLDGLAQEFNTEYREALAAAAQTRAAREQFLFENAVLQQLQAAREISVAQARVLAELEAAYGEVTPVGDLESGDKLFQVLVPKRGYVQFRVVEAGQPMLNGQPAPSAMVEEIPPGTLR